MATREELRRDLQAAHQAGRLAHAYILVGDPDGDAGALGTDLLQTILCETGGPAPCGECTACRKAAENRHEDVHRVEPQSKSRRIRVEEDIRPLTRALQLKSFDHHWKAGVILHADRMGDAAANAFLKTLEEPPAQTLILLITAAPQSLLPTLVSRCQVLTPTPTGDAEPEADEEDLLSLFSGGWPRSPFQAIALASRFDAFLQSRAADTRDEAPADEAPSREVQEARARSGQHALRARLLHTAVKWQRDVMVCAAGGHRDTLHFPHAADTLFSQADNLSLDEALRRIRALETAARRLERNLPLSTVLSEAFAPRL